MNIKKQVIVLSSLLLFSAHAISECSGIACADVKVLNMQVDIDGTVWIQTTGDETKLNCTPNSGVYLKLNGNTSGGKNIYSGLLAYKMAEKNLVFRIVENTNPCELSYIVTK